MDNGYRWVHNIIMRYMTAIRWDASLRGTNMPGLLQQLWCLRTMKSIKYARSLWPAAAAFSPLYAALPLSCPECGYDHTSSLGQDYGNGLPSRRCGGGSGSRAGLVRLDTAHVEKTCVCYETHAYVWSEMLALKCVWDPRKWAMLAWSLYRMWDEEQPAFPLSGVVVTACTFSVLVMATTGFTCAAVATTFPQVNWKRGAALHHVQTAVLKKKVHPLDKSTCGFQSKCVYVCMYVCSCDTTARASVLVSTRTRTCTRTRTRAHAHAHMRTRTRAHTLTLTLTPIPIPIPFHSKCVYVCSCDTTAHASMLVSTRTRTCAHTHSHSHPHPHPYPYPYPYPSTPSVCMYVCSCDTTAHASMLVSTRTHTLTHSHPHPHPHPHNP